MKDYTKTSVTMFEKESDNSIDFRLGSIPLYEVIPKGYFNFLHKYFAKENIVYLEEVTNELIISIVNLRGFGKSKFEIFRKILINEYLSNWEVVKLNYDIRRIDFWFSEEKWIRLRNFCYENNINDIRDVDHNLLLKYSLEYKLTKAMKQEILSIKETSEPIWYLDKIECSNSEEINRIKTPTEIIQKISDSITDTRKRELLKLKYLEDKTLEEIGSEYDITRERVRQIINKSVIEIKKILDLENIIASIKNYYYSSSSIPISKLYENTLKENDYIIRIMECEYLNMSVYAPLESIILDDKNEFIKGIEEYMTKLPGVFKLYDHIDILLEKMNDIGIENPGIFEIEKIAGQYGYRLNGEYFTKVKFTIGKVLQILFKDFIFEPLKLDDGGFAKLRKLAEEIFEFQLPEQNRSIDARIRDLSDVVLVDASTFIDINNFDYDYGCIELIDKMLIEKFKTEDTISSKWLFENNQDLLKKYGIKNKYALYSIVMYHLGDKYQIGKGNTLDIGKSLDTKLLSREDRIVQLLDSNGGSMHKNQLLENLGWDAFKLDQAIGFSRKVVYTQGQVMLIRTLKFDNETIQRCEEILKNLIDIEGYTSSHRLFNNLMFDEIGSKFILDNEISDPTVLASIFKKIFTYLKGHLMFLSFQNSKYSTMEEVIRDKYINGFERSQIKEFMEELGYSSLMVSMITERLIADGYYVQIDIDKYINRGSVIISENEIMLLKKYIENQFGDNEYLILSNLSGYRKQLPQLDGLKWNPYLIKSILEVNGYRTLKKSNPDYRYDKVIIVRNSSKIMNCEDLYFDIIKNRYNGNMHETCIYDHFTELGLLNHQEYTINKKLPYILKDMGKISIDEYKKVKLIEDYEEK